MDTLTLNRIAKLAGIELLQEETLTEAFAAKAKKTTINAGETLGDYQLVKSAIVLSAQNGLDVATSMIRGEVMRLKGGYVTSVNKDFLIFAETEQDCTKVKQFATSNPAKFK